MGESSAFGIRRNLKGGWRYSAASPFQGEGRVGLPKYMKIYNLRKTRKLRQNLRRESLPPERILWKYIRDNRLGYKFRRQHGIGNFVVDFFCPSLKLIVEVDGQIHGETAISKRDKLKEGFFENLNLRLKRYTASQINHELSVVLEDLKMFCNELVNHPLPPP